jgi:predicted DNA-binding transcriptional regulator AlpA
VSQTAPDLPDYLTSSDLARIFRVTLPTVRAWSEAGILPRPLRLGRCLRWPRAATLEALARLRSGEGGAP